MNPTDKLPPLREALERIAWRDTPIHPRGPDDFTVYLPRHVVLGIGDRHDALIRQQEARIAELEKERETFRKGFSIANDQAEHVTSLFLPVEAERDQLARKVAELEACRDALNSANIEVGIEKERLRAELAPYRELAREAHALQKERDELCASPEALVQLARIAMRLAALHKEE